MHPSRIFKTPEDLENAFEKWKADLLKQSQEWVKIQYVGKEGQRMEDGLKVPMTLDGFEIYCYKNYGCVSQYFDNKDNLYLDFVAICSRIKKEIRADQIVGGLLGVYNTSITQRLNGLKDEQSIEVKGEPRVFNIIK